jgi:ribose transport system permease protein
VNAPAIDTAVRTDATQRAGFDWHRLGNWAKAQYPLYILIALLIVASISTDSFFTVRNLSNLILQVSVIGIVTLAEFLIVLTGGIDISVGSVVGLASVLSAIMFGGSNVVLAIIVAIAVGMLVGLVNGYMVAFRGLEPFIVTLGMMALARGLVYAVTEGIPATPKAENFGSVATATLFNFPVIGLIWLILAIGVGLLLKWTVFGRRIYALGSNKAAARASGVPIRATLIGVYLLAGALVGFAGYLLTARVGTATPTGGTLYELDAIAAVVIGGAALTGGRGRVFGAVVGALIFQVITNVLVLLNVSTYLQDAVRGALILVAIGLTTVQFAKRKRARTLT